MLAYLFTAYAAGIASADFLTQAQLALALEWAPMVAMALAVLGFVLHRRVAWFGFASALGVAFFAGALALGVRIEAAAQDARLLEGAHTSPMIVQGRVAEVVFFEDGDQVLLEEVAAVGVSKVPSRVLLFRDRENSLLHYNVFPAWLPGDWVRASVKWKVPSPARNPGAMDRARMLARRGIGTEAQLSDPSLQVLMEMEGTFEPFRQIGRLREALMTPLREREHGYGLLRALVFGDRSGLSDEVRAAFARFGLAHLLAVSGLHLVCVAAPCYRIFCFLLVRLTPFARARDPRRLALLGALLVALLCGFLAGWGVPIRRAMIFLSILAIGFLRDRSTGKLDFFCCAALLVLILDPAALFSVGAQLSFAATGALMFAVPRGGTKRSDEQGAAAWLLAGLAASLRTSTTVLFLTAPLTAWCFGSLGAWGVVANVVAVPWTAFVLLPASLIGVIAVWLPGGTWCLRACLAIANVSEVAILRCDAFVSNWMLAANSAPALWACIAGFGLGLLCLRIPSTRMRLVASVALGLFLSFAPRHSLLSGQARAVFLDVGQGDAILVQGAPDADGKTPNVLVDAGTAIPGSFDAGRSVVVPALRALGVRELDLLIVTHADLDHRGGVPSVLDRVRVKEIWIPRGRSQSAEQTACIEAALPPRALQADATATQNSVTQCGEAEDGFEDLRAKATQRKIPMRERGLEDPALQLGSLQITPLWPPSENSVQFQDNDASLVVRVSGPDFSLLLPGDLERAGERAWLDAVPTQKVDILKLGHHGSRSSSTREFLEKTDATLGIVSAPCHGRFGMPHREVVERSRAQALSLWWTGRDGAVVVALEKPLWVRGWLRAPLRCP